jgi:hypothetical protein
MLVGGKKLAELAAWRPAGAIETAIVPDDGREP